MTKVWILLLFMAPVESVETPGVLIGQEPDGESCRAMAEHLVEHAVKGAEIHCLPTKGTWV